MAEKPCKDIYDEMVEAMKEMEQAENDAQILKPVYKPISMTEDITSNLITLDDIERWREAKIRHADAEDRWIEKMKEYQDCMHDK